MTMEHLLNTTKFAIFVFLILFVIGLKMEQQPGKIFLTKKPMTYSMLGFALGLIPYLFIF